MPPPSPGCQGGQLGLRGAPCTTSRELHLLCKVVGVFAFITARSHQPHAFGLQRFSVFLVSQGELRSPSHYIGRKRTAFIRGREQKSAIALQHASNFLDQSALDFRVEQKKSPQATTPSKARAKKSEPSAAAHSTGTPGKRVRNAATMVGEASTPHTLNPRSIKTCEIGTPVPHPRSRTVAPLGNVWHQPATTDFPTPELFLPRPAMNTDATSS